MRVSPYGHTRFDRQENGQAFVNGNEQKSCSVSVSGGGDMNVLTHYARRLFIQEPLAWAVSLA